MDPNKHHICVCESASLVTKPIVPRGGACTLITCNFVFSTTEIELYYMIK